MNSWIHKLMPMNRLTVLSPKLWRRFMRNIKSVCAVIRHWTLMISSCRPSCFLKKTKKHWHSTSVSSATFMLTNIRTLTKHNTSSCICWQKATIIYVWLVMPTRAFMAGVVPICRIFWISKKTIQRRKSFCLSRIIGQLKQF